MNAYKIVTIILAVAGVAATAILVWAEAEKSKGTDNSNDKIRNAAFHALMVIFFMLLLNMGFYLYS